MTTFLADGPTGIHVMYLCNGIPNANVRHEGKDTYITVPEEDVEDLLNHLDDCGYTYTRIEG